MAQTMKGLSNLELVLCKIHNKNFIYVVDNQTDRINEDVELLCYKCMQNQQESTKNYAISDAIDGINTFIAEYDKEKLNFIQQLTRLEQLFDDMLKKIRQFMKQRIDNIKNQLDNTDVKELKRLREQDKFTLDELNKFIRIQRKFIIVNTNIKEQAQIADDYLKKDAERDMLLNQILNWFTELNKKCQELQNERPDINEYISKRLLITKLPNFRVQEQIEPNRLESIIIDVLRKNDKKVERFLEKSNQIIINQLRIFHVQINKKINMKGIYISSDIDFKNQDQVDLELKIYNENRQCYFENTFTIKSPIEQIKDDNYLIFPNFCILEANNIYTFSLFNKSRPIKCRLYEKLSNNEDMNFIQNPELTGFLKNSFQETDSGLIKAFQYES